MRRLLFGSLVMTLTGACATSAPPSVAVQPATTCPAAPAASPLPTRAPPTVVPSDSASRLPPEERGKWEPPAEGRWREAMEGYRSPITTANQHPLGDRAPAFARYLNEVHQRLHPWFADRFLEWVARRPMGDPLADSRLVVRVEVAVAPDGSIAHMGVVRSSGVPAFDASALEAFARSAPFPPTTPEIRSADGEVWFHWELHRDEVWACSTRNARPFLLAP